MYGIFVGLLGPLWPSTVNSHNTFLPPQFPLYCGEESKVHELLRNSNNSGRRLGNSHGVDHSIRPRLHPKRYFQCLIHDQGYQCRRNTSWNLRKSSRIFHRLLLLRILSILKPFWRPYAPPREDFDRSSHLSRRRCPTDCVAGSMTNICILKWQVSISVFQLNSAA